MAHAKTSMFKNDEDARQWAEAHARLVAKYDKLIVSMKLLKWMAIFWVGIIFIITCWVVYYFVVLEILR